jgi:glycosyltransferase involved in cell wall biosynthesis
MEVIEGLGEITGGRAVIGSLQAEIVIPVHNEEHSLLPLYDRLTRVLVALAQPYEVIFVDDASTDRSFELLANLVETDPRLKVVRRRRNFGQTAALSAGFHEAQGEAIISLDGDLQHAPEDIPRCRPRSRRGTTSRAAGARSGSTTHSRAGCPRGSPTG